jgi:hypothetical protein
LSRGLRVREGAVQSRLRYLAARIDLQGHSMGAE